MSLKNIFSRDNSSNRRSEGEAVMDVMRPWWVWGPLAFFWHPGIDSTTSADPGMMHHTGGDAHINHNFDSGGGFGGFDGGAGGI